MSNADRARKLLTRLSPARAKSYETWMQVGRLLHQAGCTVEDWINWHPDGSPSQPAACRGLWANWSEQPISRLNEMAIADNCPRI